MITKRDIDAAKPDGRDWFLWDDGDGAVKGFGCRIFASGRKSFLIQYRTRQGATRRLTIDQVGDDPAGSLQRDAVRAAFWRAERDDGAAYAIPSAAPPVLEGGEAAKAEVPETIIAAVASECTEPA